MTITEPLVRSACTLGEGKFPCVLSPTLSQHFTPGPLWDSYTNTLHFVDIAAKQACQLGVLLDYTKPVTLQILHYNTTTRQLSRDQYAESVTCLVLRRDGAGVCIASSGLQTTLTVPYSSLGRRHLASLFSIGAIAITSRNLCRPPKLQSRASMTAPVMRVAVSSSALCNLQTVVSLVNSTRSIRQHASAKFSTPGSR